MSGEPRNWQPHVSAMVRGAMKSLDAKQTTGAGTAFDMGAAYAAFGLNLRRGTTSSTNESSSAAVVLQGSLDGTNYYTLGASVTVNSVAGSLTRSTNAIPVQFVRFSITSFTTSAGNSTAGGENKIPITGWIAAGIGSS